MKKKYDFYGCGVRTPFIKAELIESVIINGLVHFPEQFLIDSYGNLIGVKEPLMGNLCQISDNSGLCDSFYDEETIVICYK